MAGTVRRNGPSTQGSWDCPHGVISLDTLLDGLGVFGDMGLQTQILEEPYYGDIQGVPDL